MSGDHNKNKAGFSGKPPERAEGSWASTQSPAPAPGGILKDRYLIERELGRGGVGVVFLARDERLHRMPVVIKFLLDAAGQNKWLTGKFSQEAEALTRINHPGVVRVIDRDLSDDGRPFFVMEFIKGRPLRDAMKSGPMDLAYVAQIVRQIGSALHAAHEQGVFHRDLKPENIMLEQLSGGGEQIKLIDFGIAKVTNPQAGAETEVAVVAGSRQYIAPEQLLSQTASPATDIYAMAIIVYEMVTGRLPFNPQGATHFLIMQELMRLQRSESFVEPRAFRPDLPEAAQILLLNALSFDVGRRPQNARIFAEDLAQALLGNISAVDARATIAVPPPAHSSDSTPARDTLPVAQAKTASDPIPARATDASGAADTYAQPKSRILKIATGLIIVVAIAVAITWIAVKTLWPSPGPDPNLGAGSPTPSPIPQTASPEAPDQAMRTFNYWITLRKNPERFPNLGPSDIAGEEIFSAGDRVHISFQSPQPGYLYIISEGPLAQGQTPSFNILFPTPTTNERSARLAAGQLVRIPGHQMGFVFDEEQGTEKLWLIWAAHETPELEKLKRWANQQAAGEIKDAAEREKLNEFLKTRSAETPQFKRDETSKQTIVSMKGDILVKLVKLEHR